MSNAAPPSMLRRELGLFGAMMMGLGSIIGTGVFVSIGIAAGVTGPAVTLAILLAAVVATFNGLNSAQLAANQPVSGGTYEYGYRLLSPGLGFTAGWMFLLAKSASAATAALGVSGYLGQLVGWQADSLIPVALFALLLLTLLVILGLRRSNQVNIIVVSITIFALLAFILTGLGQMDGANLTPFFDSPEGGFSLGAFLQAVALMFVAYTGYGRIATLGEEVRDPKRTIPRAVIATLSVTALLYVLVGFVAVAVAGAPVIAEATATGAAPLEVVAELMNAPTLVLLIAIGAITAMIGVLLNLLLGLSRVALAMGRRRDLPPEIALLNNSGTTPTNAVIVIAVIIGILVFTGDVRTTWSFSAFTVLIYYAITNLAALQLSADERIFPRWIAWAGLAACLFLAFWVDAGIWLLGLVLIIVGLIWQQFARTRFRDL